MFSAKCWLFSLDRNVLSKRHPYDVQDSRMTYVYVFLYVSASSCMRAWVWMVSLDFDA